MSDHKSQIDEAPLTGHVYDGIQERDNPLPAWWLATFFATIIFSFMYYTHYEISGAGLTLQDELKLEMQNIEKLSKNSTGGPTQSEESLTELMAGASVLDQGKQIFAGKCAACHGQNAEGLIGPNLTDHFWIHGKGKRADILAVIQKGVLEKGMPGWQQVLPDSDVIAVAAYVFSVKDSHPANPKPPQGEEIR